MKVSFNLNFKRLLMFLIAVAAVWYSYVGVIEQTEASIVPPLLVFGGFCFWLSNRLSVWFSDWVVERGLRYHFLVEGYNEEACQKSVTGIKNSIRQMPMKDLFS